MRHIQAVILTILIPVLSFTGQGYPGVEHIRQQTDPIAVYLTWQQSPQSTISVHWITGSNTGTPSVQYRASGTQQWLLESGQANRIPYLTEWVNTVQITGLIPDQIYEYRVAGEIRKFRTMPDKLNRPVQFLAGGDIYHREDWMERLNALAASKDPEFILIGGDLAYEDGKPELAGRWLVMLKSFSELLVTGDGLTIPIIVSIGNHEVVGGYNMNPSYAPGFYSLFSFPGLPGYNVLDFGDYLSLLVLDSQHTNPVAGEQSKWLAEMLEDRQHVPHRFALYHIPAYPTFRPIDNSFSHLIRQHWVPLFEHYNLHFAFENHDHAFKRTFPIRNNRIDETGVIYLGDGAWGVSTRKTPEYDPRWYINKSSDERHFHFVTITNDRREVRVYNELDEVIDRFSQRVDSGIARILNSGDINVDGIIGKSGISGMYPLTFEMTNTSHPGLNEETRYHFSETDFDHTPFYGSGLNWIDFSNSESMAKHATGASLILDTRGAANIQAEWTATLVEARGHEYGLRFQYRIGWTDTFTDIIVDGKPVEFTASANAETETFRVTLPDELENRAHIELRWKYYFKETRIRSRNRNGDILRLQDIVISPSLTTSVADGITDRPVEFSLHQNYPNPFNPVTVIRYSIPESMRVRLAVYTMAGIRIATLVDEHTSKGMHSVSFDARDLASGTYIYRLYAGGETASRRMTLVK